MAPMRRHPANVRLGPKRSHDGPATNLTRSVATNAMMLELLIWVGVRWRSFAITSWRSGGKAYLYVLLEAVAAKYVRFIDSPRPEGQQETKPGEEEDSSIFIDGVQDWDGASLAVDRVDFWLRPQQRD